MLHPTSRPLGSPTVSSTTIAWLYPDEDPLDEELVEVETCEELEEFDAGGEPDVESELVGGPLLVELVEGLEVDEVVDVVVRLAAKYPAATTMIIITTTMP